MFRITKDPSSASLIQNLYKYTMMYQSNTTKLYYVYYCFRQHVSILIESSSGTSKIHILT